MSESDQGTKSGQKPEADASRDDVRGGRRRRKRKAKLLPRLLGIGTLLAVAGGALFLWKGSLLVDKISQVRAANKLERVEAALESGELETAFALARSAYQLDPQSPAILRLMAELSARYSSDPEPALYFLGRIEAAGALEPVDRRLRIEVLVALERWDEANERATALAEEFPADAANLRLLAKLRLMKGERRSGIQILEKAVAIEPEDVEGRVSLGAAMLESPFAEVKSRGARMLWSACDDVGEFGFQALVMLADNYDLVAPEEEGEFMERMRAHPMVDAETLLLAASWEMARYPSRRAEIIEREIAAREGRDPVEATSFYRWLLDQGAFQRILEELSVEESVAGTELFLVYLNALVAERKWDSLESLLDRAGLPMSDGQRSLAKANLWMARGDVDNDQIHAALLRAIDEFSRINAYGSLLEIGEICEERGFSQSALRVYRIVGRVPEFADEAYGRLFAVARRLRDSVMVEELADEVEEKSAKLEREFGILQRYVDLLVGNEIELGFLELCNREPGGMHPEEVLTAALAAHRMQEPAIVRRFCQDLDSSALVPGMRAVLAGLIALDRDTASRAAEIAATVPEEHFSLLLEEERELLDIARQ